MFVKPALSARIGALLKVRHPRTKALIPETGAEVPETFFWLRRLRDGDVMLAEPATGEVPSPAAAAPPAPTLVTSQEQ